MPARVFAAFANYHTSNGLFGEVRSGTGENLLRLQEQVFRRADTKPDILDAEDILEREKAACEKHALPRRAK